MDSSKLKFAFSLTLVYIRVIKSMRMRRVGHVARMGENRNAYECVVGTKLRDPLGRHRQVWEDNTKMDLKEMRLM
jgi:hypothetical protein